MNEKTNSSLPPSVFRLGILQGEFQPHINPCGQHILNSSMLHHVVTKNCRYPGIAIEAIDYILRKLQITYEAVPIFENENCGTLMKRKNESDPRVWTGYLGALQAGTVDLLVGDYTPVNDESTYIFLSKCPNPHPLSNPPEFLTITREQSGEE